jgi:hypothetical protein
MLSLKKPLTAKGAKNRRKGREESAADGGTVWKVRNARLGDLRDPFANFAVKGFLSRTRCFVLFAVETL